jgi:hypothetical protein
MNTKSAGKTTGKRGRPASLGPDAASITFRLPAEVGRSILLQKQFDEADEKRSISMSATVVNLLRYALKAKAKARSRACNLTSSRS